MAGMTGCGQGGAADASATVPVLRLLSWEEFFADEVLAEFTERTGAAIHYTSYGTTEELFDRLRSQPGEFDVIVAEDSEISRLREFRLLMPLDHSQLPDMATVSEPHRNPEYDPGHTYSVPYLWGTTLVAYRKDLIPDPEPSWSLLWTNPEGGVAMISDIEEPFCAALLHLGHDMNSTDPTELGLAGEALLAQAASGRVAYAEDIGVIELLEDGHAVVAMAYSGDAAVLAAEDSRFGVFIPQEGAPLWTETLAIPRDSASPQLAHQFLRFLMEPEVAALSANTLMYGTPIADAEPLLAPELLHNPVINPPAEILASCRRYLPSPQGTERIASHLPLEVLKLVMPGRAARLKEAGR
ncbi:spermidine/putrescine ABC transporter substrate-binding protein [soil metagenome]